MEKDNQPEAPEEPNEPIEPSVDLGSEFQKGDVPKPDSADESSD